MTVTVTCSARSHEPRVTKVVTFEEHPGPGRRWSPQWSLQPGRLRDAMHEQGRNQLVEVDVHDDDDLTWVMRRSRDWAHPGSGGEHLKRTRHTLECSLCGLRVVVRAERLDPLLDRLAQHELSTVDLATLGRMIA